MGISLVSTSGIASSNNSVWAFPQVTGAQADDFLVIYVAHMLRANLQFSYYTPTGYARAAGNAFAGEALLYYVPNPGTGTLTLGFRNTGTGDLGYCVMQLYRGVDLITPWRNGAGWAGTGNSTNPQATSDASPKAGDVAVSAASTRYTPDSNFSSETGDTMIMSARGGRAAAAYRGVGANGALTARYAMGPSATEWNFALGVMMPIQQRPRSKAVWWI